MPYLCLALAAMFWGGNYVVGHLLVAHSNPFILTQARWLITALLLCVLYWRPIQQNWSLIRQNFLVVAMLSLFGQVLFPLTLYIGLQYTSSLNAAIYMSTTPAMVLVINALIFKEHIHRNSIWGVIFSTLGVVFLLAKGHLSGLAGLASLNRGDLWTMGSALSWAFYCAFLRLKNKQINGQAFVGVSSLLGAIILIPVTLIALTVNMPNSIAAYLQWEFLLGLGYLIIFPSWLSYVFWNKGIGEIGATRGEIYTHIIPLSGGIFSIWFTAVTLHWYHLVSAALIILGIWLCSKKRQKKLHQHPAVADEVES